MIVATLRQEFTRAGRGSITRVELELGLYAGFFRKARLNGSLKLQTLTATLAVLGVKPGEFFARAFPEDLEAEEP